MSVDYSQPAAPPPVPPPPAKKGLGPLGWILIGCGGILVICLIAAGACFMYGKHKYDEFSKNPEMNAAKLAIKLNPDLELVSSDDTAKTLTIRDKKTNEVTTLNVADIKNGKLKIGTSGKGSAEINMNGGENGGISATTTDEKGQQSTFHMGAGGEAKLPDWLPPYPDGTVAGTYDTTTPEGRSAAVTVTTKDSVQQVLDFYEGKLKAAGVEVQKSTNTVNGALTGALTGTTSDQKRSCSIIVSSSEDGTQAIVSFNEKS